VGAVLDNVHVEGKVVTSGLTDPSKPEVNDASWPLVTLAGEDQVAITPSGNS
jgi:hypothetical protein